MGSLQPPSLAAFPVPFSDLVISRDLSASPLLSLHQPNFLFCFSFFFLLCTINPEIEG